MGVSALKDIFGGGVRILWSITLGSWVTTRRKWKQKHHSTQWRLSEYFNVVNKMSNNIPHIIISCFSKYTPHLIPFYSL
jgi:hypothetical protein